MMEPLISPMLFDGLVTLCVLASLLTIGAHLVRWHASSLIVMPPTVPPPPPDSVIASLLPGRRETEYEAVRTEEEEFW